MIIEIKGRNYTDYKDMLKKASPFSEQQIGIKHACSINPKRIRTIKKYFKENGNIDLEEIENSKISTWDKAVKLACYVASVACHDNQKRQIKRKNAITLLRYAQHTVTGFNCRWHAIMLSELLLTIGIKCTFITCLPFDHDDCDCHVVNHVWLPEYNKWAMIDSDMTEYCVDENNIPLSLFEMRERIINDMVFTIHLLPGVSDDSNGEIFNYFRCYWAKNLYWFSKHLTYGFDLESKNWEGDTSVYLIPPGFIRKGFQLKRGEIMINNLSEFFDS